jgi:DNA gyrase subunit B
MLRDGSYKPAKDLTPQDSLMPLYRKLSSTDEPGITIDGYEMVFDPRSNRWVFTHQLADWYNRWQGVYSGDDNRLRDKYFAGDEELLHETINLYNHRTTKAEVLDKKIDVDDIEVPGTHSFALANGVFVHNSAKQGRDRRFQAIFPLRGKILNTERARLDRIVNFEELKNLVIALGAGIGDTYDEENLRYHRIILMNDADVDGEHITTLGLTFFFRHLPQIIEEGYLYIAMPPLYKITVGRDEEYVYTEEKKDVKIAAIRKENPNANIGIQRYKGLGEMNPEQPWQTTMNPDTRIIKKVTIADAQKADDIFTTLMGNDVLPRKRFIQQHAQLADLDV